MATILEAARHLRWLLPVNHWTPLLGLLGVAVCVLAWRPLAALAGWRPLPTLLAMVSLVAALTLTLVPKGWGGNHRSLAQCLPADWAEFGDSAAHVGTGVESWLNIAMLVPLGYGLMLATRRVVWPSLLVVLLPVAIELTQVLIPGRECSVSDWIANSLGGLIGVAVGWLTQRLLRARKAARAGTPPTAQPDALTSS
jgi:glycopeptide antibiotics resistance protein